MAYEVLDDVLLWADGDYEARQIVYSNHGREDYALNTKTGSKLRVGWYDRGSALYNSYFEFFSLNGQKSLSGTASIFGVSAEEWAKILGVPYSEPEDFREGTMYRNRFKSEYGTFSYLGDLTFPWSDLSDAEIGELREEFMRLLRNIRFWGSGGGAGVNVLDYDKYFEFKPKSAGGRANAMFVIKRGSANYGRV